MPVKILVVEDNEKNRILMRDVLGYFGYEVIEAGDGEEGIRMARGHMPDIILMDIQMPVMDGITALKILREDAQTRDIKTVALTSFAMRGDREKFLNAGFDGYLSKPLNPVELPEILNKYLNKG